MKLKKNNETFYFIFNSNFFTFFWHQFVEQDISYILILIYMYHNGTYTHNFLFNLVLCCARPNGGTVKHIINMLLDTCILKFIYTFLVIALVPKF